MSRPAYILKKNKLYPLSALVIAFLLSLQCAAAAVENFTIKIGVGIGVSSGNLLGRGLSLRDAKGGKGSAADGAKVASDGAALVVGGKKFALPVEIKASSGLGWDSTRYRGALTVIASPGAPGRFTVINEVGLEDYLRGILKMEMNPEWHPEALKAQSILARTYAVKNRGRFASQGFDLDNTQNTQIYRGMNAEDPRTDAAVQATRGQIMAWNGKPAEIFYHSDSGGATADISHVWGSNIPYLKPKAEKIAYVSPYSSWQTPLSSAQVETALAKIGKSVGRVTGLEVAAKDPNGRAVTLRARGSSGTSEVSAHAFRMAVGSSVLRSTNFEILGSAPSGTAGIAPQRTSPSAPLPQPASQPAPKVQSLAEIAAQRDPLVELTNNNIFTKDELIDMLMNPQKRDSYLKIGLERAAGAMSQTKPAQDAPKPPAAPQTPVPATSNAQPGAFTFSGKGWGHGVGMSQWGAKAMADSGMKCSEILRHYFPGTTIGK
ncbi:MAG: SpoIID/LytB domain-containing protein [Synergistaceae bacterium]|jgi:stage II sporulation protein D|nr:SpoIID/LytB domain-containing protein [Synergistaceae bacterium]